MENTPNEALKQAVIALGGSKKVAPKIWPDKPIVNAAALLCNCLDDSRPEKLDFSQVLFVLRLARDAGYHGAIDFICDDLSYGRTTPIEPKDESAELMRQFIAATAAQAEIAARIEKAANRINLKVQA